MEVGHGQALRDGMVLSASKDALEKIGGDALAEAFAAMNGGRL